MSKRSISRRATLRGLANGGVIAVGLPILDSTLNANGNAFADGVELPVCFGTWFQGMGFAPGFWEPKEVGADYVLPAQFEALTPYKNLLNIYSGMKIQLDGRPASPHGTGPIAVNLGVVPAGASDPLPASVDSAIADVIGKNTRFRSIEVSCAGSAASISRRGPTVPNASEMSPVALYARIFGENFRDPNAAEFTPDPVVMLKKSVLSSVAEQRKDFVRSVSAADRERLDEYFTSLRQLENQLEVELQKPAPLAACSIPAKEEQASPGAVIEDVFSNSRLFAKLLAHALACGQTRVVNFFLSAGDLRRANSQHTFHLYTHEEPLDAKVGLQENVTWFRNQVVGNFAEALATFQGIKEGDGTLLDRMLVFYSTDTGDARVHSCENLPMLSVGTARGRLKGGIHFAAKGDTVARVGLTLQQAMGVPLAKWGRDSNETSKTITEVLVS